MTDAVKVGFVPFSTAPKGILVVFCDDALKFGPATRKALGPVADTVKRAAAANQFKGKSGSALDILAPDGIKIQRLIVIGTGKSSDQKGSDFLKFGGVAASKLNAASTAVMVLAELPGGAKLVRMDLATSRVTRVYPFGPEIATAKSYVDDVRFNGDTAYLTDGGQAGLIVLDLRSGRARRVLDGDPSTTAPDNRPIVVDGTVVRGADGTPLKVNADPFELSPDRRWLYYGPLEGPWSRIRTALLDDPRVSGKVLAANIQPWADLPPTGGTVMDRKGNLYFSDLAHDSIKRRAADGSITTVVQDPRLHWTDALFLDAHDVLWLPVPQLDRAPAFNGGTSRIQFPVQLFTFPLSGD